MALEGRAEWASEVTLAVAEERHEAVLAGLRAALSGITVTACLYLCYDVLNASLLRAVSILSLTLALALLIRKYPRLSSGTLLLGVAAAGLQAWAVGHLGLAMLTLAAAPVAGLLYGASAGLAAAAAMALACLVIPTTAPLSAGWMAAASFTIGLVGWSGGRPIDEMLERWHARSMDAYGLVESLRDHQGRLNRTIKALDVAYRLLESTNYALSQARSEAEKLRSLKSRFAASLSHELRTPLNIILGFSDIIYRNPRLYGQDQWSDALRRDLAQVQRNAGYLSELLDDILDLARLDVHAMPVRREFSSLPEVLAQVVEGVSRLAQDRHVTLVSAWPTDLPPVYLDETRIRQVLYNLLSNAIRMGHDDEVVVSAEVQGDRVVVSVSDRGPGIPLEDLETVFDEYRQLDSTSGGADRGKGLGLAIARELVRLHGGRIWAENREGGGATVSLWLPVTPTPQVRPTRGTPWTPQWPNRAKPRLAAVEHSPNAVSFLRRRLEEYDVLGVPSLEALAAQWAEMRPLAVLEVHDAGEAADQAPDLPEPVPYVRLTLPSAYAALQHSGFDGVLTKPVSSGDLLQAFGQLLALADATVLLVDDDRGFVQLLRRSLEVAGFQGRVLYAYSGTEALEAVRAEVPDLVMLDVAMPGMRGLEVLEHLRADPRLERTKVWAVSGVLPELGEQVGASIHVHQRANYREGQLLELLRLAVQPPTVQPVEGAEVPV